MPILARFVLFVLLTAGPATLSPAEQQPTRPNIIFIMVDDLGYGDIGPYGQSRFATPALDRLAREGLKFTQFYSGSTTCAPAREALMTGMHTGRTGRRTNADGPLHASAVTIAERLRAQGYRTALIGKWALGGLGSSSEPGKRGFDHWFGYLGQGEAHSHYPPHLLRNGSTLEYPGNKRSHGTAYSNDLFLSEAVTFIRESKAAPFFLYLPLTLPHADLIAPPEAVAEFAGRFPETEFKGGYYTKQPEPNAAFAAMVTLIDRSVAKLLETLATEGIDRQTILFFTSDNGPVGVGGRDVDFFQSRGGLRGEKRQLYEGGIRVPMLVRWPGSILGGRTTKSAAYLPDIHPTLLEIAGAPPAADLSGRSLLPLLLDPDKEMAERPLYWAWQEGAVEGGDGVFLEAVRLGRWKAVRTNKVSPAELYDLDNDPAEKSDLARQQPEIAQRLEEIMAQELAPPHLQ